MSMTSADIDRLHGLLERLEGHWRRVDAPILRFLQPGLDEQAIAAKTAMVDLRLPVEARAWYGWHDGVRWPEEHERPVGDITIGAVGYRPYHLERAVEEYRRLRTLDRELADHPHTSYWPETVWKPSWFPLGAMAGEDRLAISCDVPEGAPAPVRQWDTENRGLEAAAQSLTEVVATWVQMLDEGIIYWNGRMWLPDTGRADPDLWRRAASI